MAMARNKPTAGFGKQITLIGVVIISISMAVVLDIEARVGFKFDADDQGVVAGKIDPVIKRRVGATVVNVVIANRPTGTINEEAAMPGIAHLRVLQGQMACGVVT